jgi:hypothetical protein
MNKGHLENIGFTISLDLVARCRRHKNRRIERTMHRVLFLGTKQNLGAISQIEFFKAP